MDEYKDTEKKIEKFKETLFPVSTEHDDGDDDDENNYNSFVNAIFFAIRFNVERNTDLKECSLAELKESIDSSNLLVQLNQEKFNIILDYQKCNKQFHEVNMLLTKHRCFLRAVELKNKFRHLALKNKKKTKQNIVKQLSS